MHMQMEIGSQVMIPHREGSGEKTIWHIAKTHNKSGTSVRRRKVDKTRQLPLV